MRLFKAAVCVAALACFVCIIAGCGSVSNEDYNAKNHVTFKGAYAVGSESDQTVELWVLSTVDANSKENLNGIYYKNAGSVGSSGTTGPSISFDKNSYVDNYYLNKNRYDKLFAGTNYGCWRDMDTLYAGSGDKYHMVMCFGTVGKADFENCIVAEVDNVSYNFKFDTSDIKFVASRDDVVAQAAALQ